MVRKLPPLNSLRAFEAAARLESISLAADELCVTHGAVSRHVQQLEAWLGRQLFERHNRKLVLTANAVEYLAEIGGALDRIASATAKQMRSEHQGVIRINAPATLSLRWLVPRLSSFQVQFPEVEVRLSTSNLEIERVRDDVDIFIRGGPQDIPGFVGEEFLAGARLPVCAPELLEQGALNTPADLANFTLLHAATYPTMWQEWLSVAGVGELVPRQSLTLEHFYLTLQAALDGLGVAMGPMELVAEDVAEGRLVLPFAEPALESWRYFAYVPLVRKESKVLQAFIEWLKRAGLAGGATAS